MERRRSLAGPRLRRARTLPDRRPGGPRRHLARAAGRLSVTTVDRGAKAPHTVLLGHIRDQAELRGVIETLHGLHLPILRVEQVTDQIGVDGDPTTKNDDRS